MALACGGIGKKGFDSLLERVEALSERTARFRRRGLQPCVTPRLEATLLAAQPLQAKLLDSLGAIERGGGALQIGGQRSESLVQRGIVVAAQCRDRIVGHGQTSG